MLPRRVPVLVLTAWCLAAAAPAVAAPRPLRGYAVQLSSVLSSPHGAQTRGAVSCPAGLGGGHACPCTRSRIRARVDHDRA